MLNYIIKLVVPAPLKRALRQALTDSTSEGKSVHLQRIRTLERRTKKLERLVDELQAQVFELRPEIVPRTDDIERAVKDLLIKHGMPPTVNMNISKNDLMYQYIAKHSEDTKQAYIGYMYTGLQILEILEVIARDNFSGIANIQSFLDFASGYGRLTRFLVQVLDPDRIWVSDIKARAVEFQKQQFGVHGFVSSETPEDLTVAKRFDCIFVGSLFTHLPEAMFGRWLQRLYDLLTPGGMVIFTVHTSSSTGKAQQEQGSDITFSPTSEETSLHSADPPLNPNLYGTTHVSEEFVWKVIESLPIENKHCTRYKEARWGKQDIYILSKEQTLPLNP